MSTPTTAAREAVLAIHRRMTAALNAARDAALEELMPRATATTTSPSQTTAPADPGECAGCDPSGALCTGHPPAQPQSGGPGLVELGRQIAEELRLLEQCWPRGSHAAMNRTILEFYNALDADRHLAPLRQEAARLFQRDDVLPNLVQMCMHPDSEGCLAVDLDTQVALRRWAAAELRAAK